MLYYCGVDRTWNDTRDYLLQNGQATENERRLPFSRQGYATADTQREQGGCQNVCCCCMAFLRMHDAKCRVSDRVPLHIPVWGDEQQGLLNSNLYNLAVPKCNE